MQKSTSDLKIIDALQKTIQLYKRFGIQLTILFFILEVFREILWVLITIYLSNFILQLVSYFGSDTTNAILTIFSNYTIWITFLWGSGFSVLFLIKKQKYEIHSDDINVKALGRILLAGTVTYILIAAGLLVFIIPGLLFMLFFLLIPQVAVIEKSHPFRIVMRSSEIIHKSAKKSIPILIFLGLLAFIIYIVLLWFENLIINIFSLQISLEFSIFVNSLIFSLPLPLISIATTIIFLNTAYTHSTNIQILPPTPPIYVSPSREIKAFFEKKQNMGLEKKPEVTEKEINLESKRGAVEAAEDLSKIDKPKNCPNCGKLLTTSSKFCPYCGFELSYA